MRSSADRVLRLVISQYSAIEYVTRVKRAMRSSRGRRGLGSMWQFHNRGTLASSVYAFLRLFVCQQLQNQLAALCIHVLLFGQEPS